MAEQVVEVAREAPNVCMPYLTTVSCWFISDGQYLAEQDVEGAREAPHCDQQQHQEPAHVNDNCLERVHERILRWLKNPEAATDVERMEACTIRHLVTIWQSSIGSSFSVMMRALCHGAFLHRT
jgi:hypothetical protein